MKKALSVVLALILLLTLCACNSVQEPSNPSTHYSERKAADGGGHFALLNEYGKAVSEPIYSDIILYENFAVAQLDCNDFGKSAFRVLDYSAIKSAVPMKNSGKNVSMTTKETTFRKTHSADRFSLALPQTEPTRNTIPAYPRPIFPCRLRASAQITTSLTNTANP